MKRIATGQHIVEWVARQTSEFGNFGSTNGTVGIGLQEARVQYENGYTRWRTVAGVVYANWNGVNVECHIAAEGKSWATREYLGVIFDYPFNRIGGNSGAQRITVCIGEGNLPSRGFVEHLGFTLEARLEQAHPTGDLLIYRLRKPECKWLHLYKGSEREKLAA